MVMYLGPNRQEYHSLEEIGQNDGQSEVEMFQEKVRCAVCGYEQVDVESIALVKKWREEGYAPCPVLPCPGELHIVKSHKM